MEEFMITFFTYTVVGIGSFLLLGIIAQIYEHMNISLKFKKLAYERESKINFENILKARMAMATGLMATASSSISNPLKSKQKNPEAWNMIQEMMETSPDHPEISEIEEEDDIVGIIFAGNSYPPELT